MNKSRIAFIAGFVTIYMLIMAPLIMAQGGTDVTGLNLSSNSSGMLEISWTTPSESPKDYRVMWARADSPYLSYRESNNGSTSGNNYPTSNSLTLSGMDEGVEYKVNVRARYSGSAGPWAGEARTLVMSTPEELVIIVPEPTPEPEPKSAQQKDDQDDSQTRQNEQPSCPNSRNITSVALTPGVNSIKVTWSRVGNNDYTVRYTSTNLWPNKPFGNSVRGYRDTTTDLPCTEGTTFGGLTPGVWYSFQVKLSSESTELSSWSRIEAATPLTTMPTPGPTVPEPSAIEPPRVSVSCAEEGVEIQAGVGTTCTATVQNKDADYSQEWTTEPAGVPAMGAGDAFTTKWDATSKPTVTFKACNGTECTSDAVELNIVGKPDLPPNGITCSRVQDGESVNAYIASEEAGVGVVERTLTCEYNADRIGMKHSPTWKVADANDAISAHTTQAVDIESSVVIETAKNISLQVCNEFDVCSDLISYKYKVKNPTRITHLDCAPSPANWGEEVTCGFGQNGVDYALGISATFKATPTNDCTDGIDRAISPEERHNPMLSMVDELGEVKASFPCPGTKTITLGICTPTGCDSESASLVVRKPPLDDPGTQNSDDITQTPYTSIGTGQYWSNDISDRTDITIRAGQPVRLGLPNPECESSYSKYTRYSQYSTISKTDHRHVGMITYEQFPYWNYWSSTYQRIVPAGEEGRPGRLAGLSVDYDPATGGLVLHGTVASLHPSSQDVYTVFEYGGIGWLASNEEYAEDMSEHTWIRCTAETRFWNIKIQPE